MTSKVAAVDAGLRHLVVLTTDARVLAFGADVTGAPLARHVTLPPRWGKVRAISAGEDHTIALTNRGVVAAWGANDLGQLGVGDREHRLTPVRVSLPGAKGEVTHILAGHRHNLVLTERGEVYTWGDGRVGAVGAGHPKLDAAQFLTRNGSR